jgi:hypothetical protein
MGSRKLRQERGFNGELEKEHMGGIDARTRKVRNYSQFDYNIVKLTIIIDERWIMRRGLLAFTDHVSALHFTFTGTPG